MSAAYTSKLVAFAQANAITLECFTQSIQNNVANALTEDIGNGDLTAQLVDPKQRMQAYILCRQSAVICGQPYADALLAHCTARQNGQCHIDWLVEEGAQCPPNTRIAHLQGPAQTLLSAERSVLNFLQCLSATANTTRYFVSLVASYKTRIVDTRKTLPGLRMAQKYAVFIGGGLNHRIGLYDAILIKENHIASAGSIGAALACAQPSQARFVEIEVETLAQLQTALDAGANMILLDNMDVSVVAQAVRQNAAHAHPAILEASGGVNAQTVVALAATGVDRISVGSLTKDIQAVDFSMRFLPLA